jgi:alkylation response protein AidB-like acyl-CoA dehydrogenase
VALTIEQVIEGVGAVAADLAASRNERVGVRDLDPAVFTALADAGVTRLAVPVEQGGLWRSVEESTRDVCAVYRTLATGDPSTALAASMHLAVLVFVLATPQVDPEYQDAWDEQRNRIFATAAAGAWWGTISSEPGSGGDHSRTASVAVPDGDRWRLSGMKHFGSGSGITSYMLTTAVPQGEDTVDWFFTDALAHTWDGSRGVTLVREWDGRGMAATQSHAFRFEDVDAERLAWPGHQAEIATNSRGFGPALFTAVVRGVVESAIGAAEVALEGTDLRASQQMDWTDAQLDAWTLARVHDGVLDSIESRGDRLDPVRGKLVCARLAESAMDRLCRAVGGSSLSESNPFGQWQQDVKALGFLRPPWGLMYDAL